MRIPFDSLSICCIVEELQPWVGAKVERFIALGGDSLGIHLYGGPHLGAKWIVINWGNRFGRIHLAGKAVRASDPHLNHLVERLRTLCEGAILIEAKQIQGDRLVDLLFRAGPDIITVHCELMGRNSNFIVTSGKKIVACARSVQPSQSPRPVAPNLHYELPPSLEKGTDILFGPFCRTLMDKNPGFENAVLARKWNPILIVNRGCYPIPVPDPGGEVLHYGTFSEAAQAYYEAAESDSAFQHLQSSLVGQLKKQLSSLNHALAQMEAVVKQGARARHLQEIGNGLLGFSGQHPEPQGTLGMTLSDGSVESVHLDPNLTLIENANHFFERAKRSIHRLPVVKGQIANLKARRDQIAIGMSKVENAKELRDLEVIQSAFAKSLPHSLSGEPEKKKKFEGFKVKELLAPQGETILIGENATANDYLVTRLGKPNDWWFHVRGSTSAHVLLLTGNKPEKTSRQSLVFAAELAARNSVSKHSQIVAVDYTLKKYVRRQKGSKPGQVIYSHEKTLTIELKK